MNNKWIELREALSPLLGTPDWKDLFVQKIKKWVDVHYIDRTIHQEELKQYGEMKYDDGFVAGLTEKEKQCGNTSIQ